MRFRTTIWLLCFAVILWIVVRGVQKREEAREQAVLDSRRFLDMTVEEVEFLSIKSPDVDVECRREDGKWFIHSPLRARADASKLERVLSALESLSGDESISANQRRARQLKLEDYGLVTPRARISVGDRLRQRVLSIGDEAPLGDLVYVKLVSATDIVAVPVAFLNVLPPNVEAMRDRAMLHGDLSEVVRLEIQRPDRGFVQLAAVDGDWVLQQPVSCRADLTHVETILKTLFQLRVEEFIWDPPTTPPGSDDVVVPGLSHAARLEPYGLAEDEAVRVTVWGEESEQRQELLIGKLAGDSENRAYAKSWNADSIYTVPATGLDVVSMPVVALRDRTVFALPPEEIGYVSISRDELTLSLLKRPDIGWSIIEPLQADADESACSDFVGEISGWRILDFIEDASTNLASYGLEPPACIVKVGADSPAGTSLPSEEDLEQPPVPAEVVTPVMVAVGNRVEGEAAYYVLAPDGGGQVVTLPKTMVSERHLDPTQVLHFRDRMMLSVSRDRIRRISLVLDPAQLSGNGSSPDSGNGEPQPIALRPEQTELSVARDDDGGWVSEQEGAVASAAHIETVLFRMANLRASRIEAMAPGDLSRFGLDAPRVILTLGLSGDTGIQKSLLLGRATQHGVYAMVRGQDLVFVLNTSVARQLIAPLVVPAPTDGDSEGG